MDRAHAPRSRLMAAAPALCAAALIVGTAGCGPPVADAPRSWIYGPGTMRIHPITRVAPATSGSAGQVQVRVEVTDEVRAEPADKQGALTEALAARQDRIDTVTAAGTAVEQWSRDNCGSALRSTTTRR